MAVIITLYAMGVLGLIWAAINFCMVRAINPEEKHNGKNYMRMDLDNVHSLKLHKKAEFDTSVAKKL